MTRSDTSRPGFAGAIAVVVLFAALARGAHDLWAATIVHVALLAWLAAYVAVAAYSKAERPLRIPLGFPAAAVLSAFLVSTVFAANRGDAIFALKDGVAALIAFVAGANAFRADEDVDVLLMIAVPALWVQAALQAMQLTSRAAGGPLEGSGTLVNSNIQAAFALFWLPPLGFRALAARRAGARWRYLASGFAAAAAAIVLSGSTWAMLCLAIALFAAWAVAANKPGLSKAIIISAVLAVAAALAYKVVRDQAAAGAASANTADRLYWWVSAVRMFLAHPVTGVGPGGYPSAYLAFKAGAGQNTLFAHSLPFTVLAELGGLGAAAMAWFLIAWRRAAGPVLRSRGAFAAGALLFIIACVVNVGGEYLVNQITLGLFLGITIAPLKAPQFTPRPSVAIVAVAVAVLALPALVSPFMAGRLVVDGRAALAERDFATAEKRFDAACALDSTAWEAFQGRALARWADGTGNDKAAAIDDMDRAGALNQFNGTLWWEKGLMLRDAGRIQEARVALDHARGLRPRDPRIAADLAAAERLP